MKEIELTKEQQDRATEMMLDIQGDADFSGDLEVFCKRYVWQASCIAELEEKLHEWETLCDVVRDANEEKPYEPSSYTTLRDQLAVMAETLTVTREVFSPLSYIEEELAARGWSWDDLAEKSGLSADLLKGNVDDEVAGGLSRAFSTSKELWLGLGGA